MMKRKGRLVTKVVDLNMMFFNKLRLKDCAVANNEPRGYRAERDIRDFGRTAKRSGVTVVGRIAPWSIAGICGTRPTLWGRGRRRMTLLGLMSTLRVSRMLREWDPHIGCEMNAKAGGRGRGLKQKPGS